MRREVKKIIILLIFLCIYISIDYVYIFLNNDIFYPSEILNSYKEYNSELELEYENSLFATEYSRVLYRDVYNFQKEITIYKGLDYNLGIGMPVINESGLVGFVSEVYKTSSKVTLLSNKSSDISVKVGDSYGVLSYVDGMFIISNLSSPLNKSDDEIYTSGLANMYGGIFIGLVEGEIEGSLKTKYEVKLASNLNEINYLYIIKDVK